MGWSGGTMRWARVTESRSLRRKWYSFSKTSLLEEVQQLLDKDTVNVNITWVVESKQGRDQ